MPRYTIPNENGEHKVKSSNDNIAAHVLTFSPVTGSMDGQVVVKTRAPGSTVFEDVQGSPVDLSAPTTLTFTFAVAEYSLTLTSATANAKEIEMQDTVKEL